MSATRELNPSMPTSSTTDFVTGEPRTIPPDMEALTRCPGCAGDSLTWYCRSTDRLYRTTRQQFEYSTCDRCGLLFQSVRPTAAAIADFYPRDYSPYSRQTAAKDSTSTGVVPRLIPRLRRVVQPLTRWIAHSGCAASDEELLDSIYEPPDESSSFLDFGCGSDAALNRARDLGWRTAGIDFSAMAVDSARQSGHRAWQINECDWEQLRSEGFSLIRLSHVLEHLFDPLETIRQLVTVLKPGGVLHLALPNPTNPLARLFRSNWLGLDAPRHITIPSATVIRQWLEEAGLNVEAVCQQHAAKDIARSMGFCLQRMGLCQQRQPNSFGANRLLLAAASVPSRILARCGRGDRFHIVARKPIGGTSEIRLSETSSETGTVRAA